MLLHDTVIRRLLTDELLKDFIIIIIINALKSDQFFSFFPFLHHRFSSRWRSADEQNKMFKTKCLSAGSALLFASSSLAPTQKLDWPCSS